MRIARDLLSQFKSLRRTLFVVFAATSLIPFALVVIRMAKGIPIRIFTIDPAATMNAPFYVGIVSTFGIVLWGATAAVCLFSHALSRKRKDLREFSQFCLATVALTLLVLADDQLQIHEKLVPYFLRISEAWVYGLYLVLTMFYSLRFRKFILKSNYLILALGAGFFALSIAADFFPHDRSGHYLWEDGSKLFGIVSWLTYNTVTCFKALQEADSR
ncbi:MAG: hypothetical protein V1495_00225 [Pseudomonadota bacterium]